MHPQQRVGRRLVRALACAAALGALTFSCKRSSPARDAGAAPETERPRKQQAVPKPERPRTNVADLESSDADVRLRAVRGFAKNPPRRPEVVDKMVALLDAKDPGIRLSAATALTYVKDAPAAAARLRTALGDVDPLVKFQALKALARRADPAALDGVLTTLGDKDQARRAWAVAALGKLGAPARAHWKKLLPHLGDSAAVVRLQAVRAIGRLGDKAALAPLVAMAKKHGGIARAQVVRALEDLDVPAAARAEALATIEAK